MPYNSSKRCCCRRVAFDKDAKFCCAINVSSHLFTCHASPIAHLRAAKSSKSLIRLTQKTMTCAAAWVDWSSRSMATVACLMASQTWQRRRNREDRLYKESVSTWCLSPHWLYIYCACSNTKHAFSSDFIVTETHFLSLSDGMLSRNLNRGESLEKWLGNVEKKGISRALKH